MSPLVHWVTATPSLRRPILLVALEGFVDAGAVSSTASAFLRHRWQSELVATFDGDDLIDYRARRPSAVVDNGELRRIEWPALELYAARVEGPHDVLLLLGPEPDMRWGEFLTAVAEICTETGVEAMVGLGAYPAAAPHTRPIRILRAANGLGGELVPEAGAISGYTGPVGAGTALEDELARHGVPGVGLWAEVPHYIAGSPNPAAALAMVRLVADTLSTSVDTTELEAAAKLHAEQVAQAVAEHPEAIEMVEALEQHHDADDSDSELPSGEVIAAEIERFLRSQTD